MTPPLETPELRFLDTLRTALLNARDVCDQPEIVGVLTEQVDRIDDRMLVVMQERNGTIPVTAPESFDMGNAVNAMFAGMSQPTRIR